MVGTTQRLILGIALTFTSTLRADDPPKPDAPDTKPPTGRPDPSLGDVATPFVPLQPRTSEDRDRIDALRDYAAARALEKREDYRGAASLLEEALKKDPESVAILRRLSHLELALRRPNKAAEYSRKVIEADPGDSESLDFLVRYHLDLKNDVPGAEGLLKSVLANPRLDKDSAAYVLANRDLGLIYARSQAPKAADALPKAADALAKVLDALDEKAASRLSPLDQRLILGGDEAGAYIQFGEVFFRARRYDLAIRAFQRGLAYDADHPILPRLLAQSLLKAGRPAEALAALEPYLRRQPPGSEPYELLADILTALKKPEEILPRLEAAAKADPKNLPLQYALADRYREAGKPEKANAIYNEVLTTQPDPQGFGRSAAALLKEKKYEELIKLLGKAINMPNGLEAVRPQIESIINDPISADQCLDAGMKMQEAGAGALGDDSLRVLTYVGLNAKKFGKLVPLYRLRLKQSPSPQAYKELASVLLQDGKAEAAADTFREMFEKYPAEKTPQGYLALWQSLMRAGKTEAALDTIREAAKLDADNVEVVRLVGYTLSQLGRNDEAIAHYKAMLEKFKNNDEAEIAARSGLSIIYTNMEQMDKAEQELEILLAKHPDDAGVNNDLGYLYADRGKNLDKAEAMIRKAVEEQPTNSAYLDSLGWVLFKRGKIQESVEPLEKAIKNAEPPDATILDHLGDAYFQLKDYAKARTAWEQAETYAAKATPPDKKLSEIRKKLTALNKLSPSQSTSKDDNP